MAADDRPEINMSSIKVAGIGGLGLVAVVFGMAVEMPVVRVFAIVSAAGGIIGGLAFIAYRRWVRPDPPHGPTLMVEMSPDTVRPTDPVEDTTFKLSPVASSR